MLKRTVLADLAKAAAALRSTSDATRRARYCSYRRVATTRATKTRAGWSEEREAIRIEGDRGAGSAGVCLCDPNARELQSET